MPNSVDRELDNGCRVADCGGCSKQEHSIWKKESSHDFNRFVLRVSLIENPTLLVTHKFPLRIHSRLSRRLHIRATSGKHRPCAAAPTIGRIVPFRQLESRDISIWIRCTWTNVVRVAAIVKAPEPGPAQPATPIRGWRAAGTGAGGADVAPVEMSGYVAGDEGAVGG